MNRKRLTPIALGLVFVMTLSCRSVPERSSSLDNAVIAAELAAESSPTEKPEFSIGRYVPDMDSGQFEDQLYARDGNTLYVLQRHCPGSRILVIDLAGDALIASVDLVGDEWFTAIGWSDAIRRLICLDPDGAVVLIDPADGWAQESIALEGPAFPRRLVIRGDLLLVAHHNETRLDAFDMRDGMIHLRRTYEVDGSNVAPLDDRRCLLGDVDLTLLDLETGEETKLINLPEWEEYATVMDNLVYDDAARAAYFRHAGYVYAYAADPSRAPTDSVAIGVEADGFRVDAGEFRVNAGYLYRLDRDAYAYGTYSTGIIAEGGELLIGFSDWSGETLGLSRSRPFSASVPRVALRAAPGAAEAAADQDRVRTAFALARADSGRERTKGTGKAFAKSLLTKPRYLERDYAAAFSDGPLAELFALLAEDEVLRRACAEELRYLELPGDRRYVIFGEAPAIPEGLAAIEAAAFPSNPWVGSGTVLLCMRRRGDETAAEKEYRSVTDRTGGYDLPPETFASRDYRLVLRFPLWSDPDDPEAEPERIRLHLSERYPGFLSLEPLEE